MEKVISEKTMLKAFVYSVFVVLTIVFLWFTPQPAWTQNSQMYRFLDIGFKVIILLGIADSGFKCFSNKESSREVIQRAWVMLPVLCFMAFARSFVFMGLILMGQ